MHSITRWMRVAQCGYMVMFLCGILLYIVMHRMATHLYGYAITNKRAIVVAGDSGGCASTSMGLCPWS